MLETRETTQAIEVEHLVKRYPHAPRNAVDDISFSVRRGDLLKIAQDLRLSTSRQIHIRSNT